MAKVKNAMAAANLDESLLKRQAAIIDSMTPGERRNPDLLKASRKKRIAAGSGTKVEEINRLLKMHRQMSDVMKTMGKSGRGGGLAGLGNMLGLGGGMGGLPKMTPEQMKAMAKNVPGGGALPPGFPGGLGGGGLPPGFPGSGGLPGLPGLGKKK
jgi:signal recognition particle subunit SRP54